MSGIDNILDAIDMQGKHLADELIKNAELKADEIRAEGRASAQAEYDRIIASCHAECEQNYAAYCSAAESAAKRELLAYKTACIDKIINNAVEAASNLTSSEYFNAILKMAEKHLHKGNAVIYFNYRDFHRMPEDFENKLKSAAAEHECVISLSEDTADIDGGFILDYGRISENCSFKAIAEAERTLLREKTAEILFGRS